MGCHGDGDHVWLGGQHAFPPPVLLTPSLSWWGRPRWCWAFLGGGVGPLSPEAIGQGGRCPGAWRLHVRGKLPLRFMPRAPPPHLGVSQLISILPPSLSHKALGQAPCPGLWVLITVLACVSLSYLRLGPQSTWPPGLCLEGSQAVGANCKCCWEL